MALTSGTKLGPYEIQSPLGAGGMGEVYRAVDTRLDRTVAIKVLPAHLSSDPELKQRLEREAKTISSLQHVNICTLYDIGTQGDTDFLVMEYLEGQTLADRLQKGPLPIDQLLKIATEIAQALEKAHQRGITHRDLKPANIMLTQAGAKLMDFGLAKPKFPNASQALGTFTPSTPTMNLASLTSAASPLTQKGSIVGTFQYMAPEVLQGADSDARSDVFSLGCVLYEMVTGRRAFEGKTQLSVMSAILEKDPEPLANVQPTSPAALDYTVRSCLEKNPDERIQTAHDVKLQLAWIGISSSQTGAPALPSSKPRPTLWLAAIAVLALAVMALTVALMWSAPARRVLRVNLLPPEGTRFETLYRNGAPALSPDGTHLAFIAQKDGRNSLWLRSFDRLDATPVRGTDDAYFPFWSPDGTAVAFFMQGKLWRTDLNGGSPAPICDAPEARGGSWGSGNVIVFAPSFGGPLVQVSAAGGKPKAVTGVSVVSSTISDRWPSFLPDGKHFLFLHSPYGNAADQNEVHLGSLDGGDQLVLRGKFYGAQYAAGWLLAVRDGSLLAWKFDASSGKASGDPVPVVDKVASDEITALSVVSVSAQGMLLYQSGAGSNGDRHVWMDATGTELSQLSEPTVYGPTRISPDGSRIATPVISQFGNSPLWIWDLAGGTRSLASAANEYVDATVWSADGRTLYFDIFNPDLRTELRMVAADGSQPERILIKSDRNLLPVDVTSDGKWLLYEEAKVGAPTDAELKAFPLVSGLQPLTVLEPVADGSNARLKPGSNDWLAYQSNQSGRAQVYLTRFPHPGAKYQVSKDGGVQPVWSKDGKTLYYLDPYRKLTAVDIQTSGEAVQIGAAKPLFTVGIRHSISTEAYDIARDGRFLVVDSITESTAPLVLVTNWDAELKK
jgi:serine/threonine protein kinase/Tol biopolymer transport system component